MMPADDRRTTTDEQETLAAFVAELLDSAGAAFSRTKVSDTEPWYRFVLEPTGNGSLNVFVNIAPDMFELDANGANLRLARVDFSDGTMWITACRDTMVRLAENDLTIRLRRTLLGKTVGAVQIPSAAGDHLWNGDLLACGGKGSLYTYRDWLRAAH